MGTLFPACNSSGLGRKGSTAPDGGSPSDGGSSEISATTTGGAVGTNGTGAVTATGGLASTGGVTATGGVTGVTTSGGVTSSGGVTRTGGVTNAGGVTTSGGSTTSGGVTSSGGITRTGGVTNAGGVTTSGGSTTSGGVTSSGGTTSSGGVMATGGTTPGHFQMENLDRGLVAVTVAGGVYVGWRMFGHEYDATASNVSYGLYRDGTKLATVTDSTNFLDAAGTATSKYTVTAVIKGTEGSQSPAVAPWAQNYLRIPLDVPPLDPQGQAYEANEGSPGDLDGDGQYDIVLKWDPLDSGGDSIDVPGTNVLLDGYTLAGRRLWRITLGPNSRGGAHYTPLVVYDFDGDGKAEVAVKTAPGTKDGTGTYLHMGPAANDDDSALYANSTGYILTGPEYLTVFNGATGAEMATVNFEVERGNVADWGDIYGNRADRFLASAGFVSDAGNGSTTASGRPSILMARGYYVRSTITAWNWRDGKLTKVWTSDSNTGTNYTGQGAHSMMVADADGDGAQEIIYGASTIASNGTKQCSTGFGHGDALHVGVLVPSRPGIQVFMPHESGTQPTLDVHDAFTCEVIYQAPASGTDNGRGAADDIDPNNPGAEMWSTVETQLESATDGHALGTKPSGYANFLIYWDADESREIEDRTSIVKYGGSTLLNATGCLGSNGTKNTPVLTADLLGDWREEIVLRESLNTALRVYATTDVTARRIYTLMHDPQYRMQVTSEQTGYNQPPHVGFHIGAGMADPPKPDIHVK